MTASIPWIRVFKARMERFERRMGEAGVDPKKELARARVILRSIPTAYSDISGVIGSQSLGCVEEALQTFAVTVNFIFLEMIFVANASSINA